MTLDTEVVRDLDYIRREMSRRMTYASKQMRLMEILRGQASDSLVPQQEKEFALALIEAHNVSRMLTLDLKTVLDAHAVLEARVQTLREALEFYADEDHYDAAYGTIPMVPVPGEKYMGEPDKGRTARAALAPVLTGES